MALLAPRLWSAGVIATLSLMVVGFDSSPLAHGVPSEASVSKRLCHPYPPDYIGCSRAQINRFEVGTKRRMIRHYNQNRWGQRGGASLRGLTISANRYLRRHYRAAVTRYVHRMRAKGVVGKGAYPRYRTWNGFKANLACVNGFMGSAWGFMCDFSRKESKIAKAGNRFAITCGGWVFGAVSADSGYRLFKGTPLEAGEAIAAGGAAGVGCATQSLWDGFFRLFRS